MHSNKSPDSHGRGLAPASLNPLRYDGHTHDPRECAGILKGYMPENVRVLDVGCGTGSVTLIANDGKTNVVLGIEPDPIRVEAAKKRGLEVITGYLTRELMVERGPFDVVMFADVLEHTADPASIIELASSGLTERGLILISVPNAVHWIMRLQILFGKFDYASCGIRDSTHLRWFTKKTMTNLLNELGFDVEEFRFSSGVTLPEYFTWRPWKWVGIRYRIHLIHLGLKLLPTWFGAQLLIKARKQAPAD